MRVCDSIAAAAPRSWKSWYVRSASARAASSVAQASRDVQTKDERTREAELRKNVDDAISRARGKFKLPPGVSSDDLLRELRGRAPGDPVDP